MRRQLRNRWVIYGLAVVLPVFALFVRQQIAPYLGERTPFLPFFVGMLLVASIGGFRPGLVATLIGGLLAGYYVISSDRSLVPSNMQDGFALASFYSIGIATSYVCGRFIDLQNREHALRLMFQQTLLGIGDAIISVDPDRRIRLMNRVAEDLTGWTRADAELRPLHEVFRATRNHAPVSSVDAVLATGKPVSLSHDSEILSRDGRQIPIAHTASPITDPDGSLLGAVLIFRDVTKEREAIRALAAAEHHARTILESISEAFVLLDRDWRFAKMNAGAAELLQVSIQSVFGVSFWDRFPALRGTELEAAYRRAMQTGVSERFDFFSPVSHRWVSISAYPSEEGLAIYFRDIDQRKREESELRRLNEDLKQFTYAASHDLREPLRMITVYSELLADTLGAKLEGKPAMFLANMVGGAQRIGRLIDGLLKFTQIGALAPVNPQPVDSAAALKEALELLQLPLQESEARVIYGEMPIVLSEPSHLTQVFQNLIANALKYTPHDVHPEIRITTKQIENGCTFCVTDNGIGIEPQFQAQIFQPFKRLHGPDVPGAGIGLATCKRIIEHYGGRIWVESDGPGNGSTFCFSLPLVTTQQSVAQA